MKIPKDCNILRQELDIELYLNSLTYNDLVIACGYHED